MTSPASRNPARGQDRLRVDPESAPLSPRDRRLLEAVESSLAEGLVLRRWWQRHTNSWAGELTPERVHQWFPPGPHTSLHRLTRDSIRWPQEPAYGFTTQARLGSRTVPVWGLLIQQQFDRLVITPEVLQGLSVSAGASETASQLARRRWQSSLRAFVLRDFLRVAGYHSIYTAPKDPNRRPLANYLRALDLQQEDSAGPARGLLSSQIYYQRSDSGRVGKFRTVDRRQIDGRSVLDSGPFEWIVLRVESRSTGLEFAPLGDDRPKLVAPVTDDFLMVLDRRFYERIEPSPGSHQPALYGLGYAYLIRPANPLAPTPGFWSYRFLARHDGQILAQQVGIWHSPQQISADILRPVLRYLRPEAFGLPATRLGFNPIRQLFLQGFRGPDPVRQLLWGIDQLSGGLAHRIGLSNRSLEKRILLSYVQRALVATEDISWVWRAVGDWRQKSELPLWAQTGAE